MPTNHPNGDTPAGSKPVSVADRPGHGRIVTPNPRPTDTILGWLTTDLNTGNATYTPETAEPQPHGTMVWTLQHWYYLVSRLRCFDPTRHNLVPHLVDHTPYQGIRLQLDGVVDTRAYLPAYLRGPRTRGWFAPNADPTTLGTPYLAPHVNDNRNGALELTWRVRQVDIDTHDLPDTSALQAAWNAPADLAALADAVNGNDIETLLAMRALSNDTAINEHQAARRYWDTRYTTWQTAEPRRNRPAMTATQRLIANNPNLNGNVQIDAPVALGGRDIRTPNWTHPTPTRRTLLIRINSTTWPFPQHHLDALADQLHQHNLGVILRGSLNNFGRRPTFYIARTPTLGATTLRHWNLPLAHQGNPTPFLNWQDRLAHHTIDWLNPTTGTWNPT